MNNDVALDVTRIRDLIERWVVYRDAFLWDEFRKVWHEDGVMIATWSQSSYEEFIKNTEAGRREHGLWYLHILGGSGIRVNETRATSLTKMIITQRINLHGEDCDVQCFARHYDFWDKREERWGLVRRETICDKDQILPVPPSKTPELDAKILDHYPEEYRRFAYAIRYNGYPCSDDVPRFSGQFEPDSSLAKLYARGDAWLDGAMANPNAAGIGE
jgi:hypothetical protein